jgi:hypothetical protein
MAHYALIDTDLIVVEVIAGNDENTGGIDWENYYSQITGLLCKRTSYTGSIRGIFAGVGYRYDAENDLFVAPLVDESPLPPQNGLEIT